MKGTLVVNLIKQQQNELCKKTKKRHEKKIDNLVINKRINDGIQKNHNQTITNLSDIELQKMKGLQLWKIFMTKLLAKIF